MPANEIGAPSGAGVFFQLQKGQVLGLVTGVVEVAVLVWKMFNNCDQYQDKLCEQRLFVINIINGIIRNFTLNKLF